MPYGNRFREYRKYFHQLIGSRSSMEQFHPIEELETHIFLKRVAEKPAELAAHVRRWVYHQYSSTINLRTESLIGRLVQSFYESRTVTSCRGITIHLLSWPIRQPSNSRFPPLQVHFSSTSSLFSSTYLLGYQALVSKLLRRNGPAHSTKWWICHLISPRLKLLLGLRRLHLLQTYLRVGS